ncbi:MAG TPA: hypothetical protein VNC78_12910 [Actinomycetota bacterium]|nr:hypothetical protein [Actinomycetota bacterium]
MGESVTFQAPDRISYRWTMGPLLEVREEVMLEETGAEKTVMTFVGRFEPPKGVVGWFRGATVVRRVLDRFVHNYIAEGKLSAEALFVRVGVAPIA